MNTLQLKVSTRKPRVLDGHPWVFAGEVEQLLEEAFDGRGVELLTPRGRSLGTGIYSHHSQIVWRRFAGPGGRWDSDHFRSALGKATARRPQETIGRLVWSEADDMPGLVIDRFDDILVVQSLTKGVEAAMEEIVDVVLAMVPGISDVVYRNDAPSRRLEGLPLEVKTRSGREVSPRWYRIREMDYRIDLMRGQKTGFYLDQRDEHVRVGQLASGRRVLDAFCNQGAFGLQCAAHGARAVLCIDSSSDALDAAGENARRNGFELEAITANVFDWLTANRTERFDLIILDPPSFAPNRRAVEGALRGYKQLHLRALQILNPGGLLATYSCSHHISHDLFLQNLTEATSDTRRTVQLVRLAGQPEDHPVRLGFPESAYLKGALLRVD